MFSVDFPTLVIIPRSQGEDALYYNCVSYKIADFMRVGTMSTFLITVAPEPSTVPGT